MLVTGPLSERKVERSCERYHREKHPPWKRSQDRLSPPARAATLLCFVAAGATTEQIGLALAATLALTAAVLLCRRRARPLVALLPPLLTASGAATVLLSPATLKRAEEAAVTAPLFQNIPPFAASLAGILPHLALAVLALGLWAARDERCPRVLRLCLAAAPLSLLLSIFGAQIPAALTVLVPLAAALLLLSGEWLWTGALCLLASLTALVMLPTGVAEPRVLLPTALLASLLASSLLHRALAAAPLAERAALTAALLLSTALFLPTLDSCLANARLTAKNEAAIRRARESGRLLYDFGYDRRTCHALITDDGFFYRTFLAYHDLEEVEVCLTAAGTAPLFTPDGQRLRSPALREGGRLFFPVRDTVEALGGTVSEEEGRTVFRIGDEWAVLQGEHLYCPVGPEQLRLSLKGRRPTRYFAFAVPAEVLEETLGVRPVPQGEGFVMTPVDG